MIRFRWFSIWPFLSALVALSLVGCGSSRLPTPLPPVPTLPPLGPIANYRDMGVSVGYPAGWSAFYGVGQLLIAPSAEATRRQPPTEPLVSLQVATLAQLGADKLATLKEIARVVSGGNRDLKILSEGQTQFATLDAYFVDIQETTTNLIEQTIAFRLPDGRIGWLIGLAPLDGWANFAPTFDGIRASGTLSRSTDYQAPPLTGSDTFARGKLTIGLPTGWTATDLGAEGRLYHNPAEVTYHDGSGFANGPQLVIRALPLQKGQALADALGKLIGAGTLPFTQVTVGGQPGLSLTSTDPVTGQQVTLIGALTPDDSTLVAFRWTTPGALVDVTRPVLEGMLASVVWQPVAF